MKKVDIKKNLVDAADIYTRALNRPKVTVYIYK